MILAGLLLKLGGYGLLRVALPTVPDAFSAWDLPIVIIAIISAIYGAAVAMAQSDLKRLVAFTSVNHMGYVLLGVAVAAAATASPADRAAAATGAAYQMVAHGLVTGMLFSWPASLLTARAHATAEKPLQREPLGLRFVLVSLGLGTLVSGVLPQAWVLLATHAASLLAAIVPH